MEKALADFLHAEKGVNNPATPDALRKEAMERIGADPASASPPPDQDDASKKEAAIDGFLAAHFKDFEGEKPAARKKRLLELAKTYEQKPPRPYDEGKLRQKIRDALLTGNQKFDIHEILKEAATMQAPEEEPNGEVVAEEPPKQNEKLSLPERFANRLPEGNEVTELWNVIKDRSKEISHPGTGLRVFCANKLIQYYRDRLTEDDRPNSREYYRRQIKLLNAIRAEWQDILNKTVNPKEITHTLSKDDEIRAAVNMHKKQQRQKSRELQADFHARLRENPVEAHPEATAQQLEEEEEGAEISAAQTRAQIGPILKEVVEDAESRGRFRLKRVPKAASAETTVPTETKLEETKEQQALKIAGELWDEAYREDLANQGFSVADVEAHIRNLAADNIFQQQRQREIEKFAKDIIDKI